MYNALHMNIKEGQPQSIEVLVSHEKRQEYLDAALAMEGLSHITEDELAAYCPISLTNTPEDIKPRISELQNLLMHGVLEPAGITAYNPSTAPFSPDRNLTSQPNEIYQVDSGKIAGSRFFAGHNILPSTGVGIEIEKAKELNRMAVVIMDQHVRISRMLPHRIIYLQQRNFAEQLDQFIAVFQKLLEYDPAIGLDEHTPALLGTHKESGETVNLEKLIYTEFPELKFIYDGLVPSANFALTNPEILDPSLN